MFEVKEIKFDFQKINIFACDLALGLGHSPRWTMDKRGLYNIVRLLTLWAPRPGPRGP